MSNAKRAIMVPVMTLAVCAIAMVGLGFALTTSVTSNSNTVEKLMIDLNDDAEYLAGLNQIDNTSVNGLFSIVMSTEKTTIVETNDQASVVKTQIKYNLDRTSKLETYVKAMGNVTDSATLTITFADSNTVPILIKITKMEVSNDSLIESGESYTIALGGETGEPTATININTVYKVTIQKVFGATAGGSNIVTYGAEIPTLPDMIGLTFTAEKAAA